MQINRDYVPVAGTFSKDTRMFGGDYPIKYIKQALGSQVQDQDGRWYTDWVSGLGANLVGFSNFELTQYIIKHLRRGNGFSLPSQLEYKAAERLVSMLSNHIAHWRNTELQVRWVNSGSDACTAAIRLARSATGRTLVCSFGYHGWGDQFIANTPPAHGIPDSIKHDIISFNYGEMPATAAPLAAVILEHPLNDSIDARAYYQELREFCDNNGCLLIIDEVVTGLRYALGGVCELYDIQPDIVCMGKGLSAGHPLAAIIASKDLMTWFSRVDPVFVSGTNIGSVAGLAAANWLMLHYNSVDVLHIAKIGGDLKAGLAERGVPVLGDNARHILNFTDEYQRAYFIQEMASYGVIMNRPNFATTAHGAGAIASTLQAVEWAMKDINSLSPEQIKARVGDQLPMVLFRNR
jgi:glutamate-1-semialdehyde 2,1-aminomutase